MSEPYYQDEHVTLYHGDCMDVMATLPDESVHAVVTDPPYGLANTTPEQVADTIVRWVGGDRDYLPSGGAGFMGKAWDAFVPPVAVWDECLRVLKPGGYVLTFAGSRTHDLMTLALRLAGFDIRDSIAWLYGSGFPKSLDVSKAIDKAAGAEREVVGKRKQPMGTNATFRRAAQVAHGYRPDGPEFGQAALDHIDITAPATPDAEKWQGWGTALKPAFEPIVVARKPLTGTVAANVLAHGTGALNIDASRIGTTDSLGGGANKGMTSSTRHEGFARPWMDDDETREAAAARSRENTARAESMGRWPTNVLLDDTQAAELDRQSGVLHSQDPATRASKSKRVGVTEMGTGQSIEYADQGGASRFFPTFRYEAKAPSSERPRVNGIAHPTVKPLDLMRWVVRLVTPPGGTVLDPFAGSGTTAEACLHEGFRCIAIEREADYLPLIKARLDKPMTPPLDLGSLT